jgi:hypothetical protein
VAVGAAPAAKRGRKKSKQVKNAPKLKVGNKLVVLQSHDMFGASKWMDFTPKKDGLNVKAQEAQAHLKRVYLQWMGARHELHLANAKVQPAPSPAPYPHPQPPQY